ncbi:MAG TPA: hypothetical protein VFA15_08570 [Nitrososphaera sp.]|nr:hypothetical protein [Nitrososphaera sp.]
MSKSTSLAVISGALMIASMSWETSFPSAFAGNGASNPQGAPDIKSHLFSKATGSNAANGALASQAPPGIHHSVDGKVLAEQKSSEPRDRSIDQIQMDTLKQDLAEIQKELMQESRN